MTVWVYVDTSKQVGERDHVKVFASPDAALAWFELNAPGGVAFEYEVRRAAMTTREAHDRFQKEVGNILDELKRNP